MTEDWNVADVPNAANMWVVVNLSKVAEGLGEDDQKKKEGHHKALVVSQNKMSMSTTTYS